MHEVLLKIQSFQWASSRKSHHSETLSSCSKVPNGKKEAETIGRENNPKPRTSNFHVERDKNSMNWKLCKWNGIQTKIYSDSLQFISLDVFLNGRMGFEESRKWTKEELYLTYLVKYPLDMSLFGFFMRRQFLLFLESYDSVEIHKKNLSILANAT